MNQRELIPRRRRPRRPGCRERRSGRRDRSGQAANLVELASACIQIGEECQAHCLQLLGTGDTSLAGCARSVTMMLAMCRALVTAAAQGSPRLKDVARVCGQVCRDCEKECKPHAGHHDICRRCMESCRACAAGCEKVSA